jgi:hypothetical protein
MAEVDEFDEFERAALESTAFDYLDRAAGIFEDLGYDAAADAVRSVLDDPLGELGA